MQAVTVDMTGTVLKPDGSPDAGACVFIGLRVDTQAPPFVTPVIDPDNPPPTPVELFSTDAGDAEPFPMGVFGDEPNELWRKASCGTDGRFTCTMPTPETAGWCAGAQTDADIDPERGGLFIVSYRFLSGFGRPRVFAYDPAKVADGALDITDAVSAGV